MRIPFVPVAVCALVIGALLATYVPASAGAQNLIVQLMPISPDQHPADADIDPGSQDVTMFGLEIMYDGGFADSAQLDDITFTAGGTGDDIADIVDPDGVSLMRVNEDGTDWEDVDDIELSGVYTGPEGDQTILFNLGGVNLDGGDSIYLKLIYDFVVDTPNGTFNVSIADEADLGFQGDPEGVEGIPLIGREVTVVNPGRLLVSNNPPGGSNIKTVIAGTTNHVILDFDALAQFDPITLNSIVVEATGDGLDNTEIANVLFVHDENNSGIYEPTMDTLLDSAVYAADNGTLTLDATMTGLSIDQGAIERFLIVYDFNSTALEGHDFRCNLITVNVDAATGEEVEYEGGGSGLLSTYVIFIDEAGTIIFHEVNPGDFSVSPLSTNVIGIFDCQATVNVVELQQLTCIALGTFRDELDFVTLRLVEDVNMDGEFLAGDLVLDNQVFLEDNGEVIFEPDAITGAPFRILADQTRRLMLVAVTNQVLVEGTMFALRVDEARILVGSILGLPNETSTITAAPPKIGQLPPPGCAMADPTGSSGRSSLPVPLLLATMMAVIVWRRRQ